MTIFSPPATLIIEDSFISLLITMAKKRSQKKTRAGKRFSFSGFNKLFSVLVSITIVSTLVLTVQGLVLGDTGFTQFSEGGSTAILTAEKAKVGTMSLQLHWEQQPECYYPDPNSSEMICPLSDAGVNIDIMGTTTLNDLPSWSYWTWVGRGDYITNITFFLDGNDDGEWDYAITAIPFLNDPTATTPIALEVNDWVNVTETSISSGTNPGYFSVTIRGDDYPLNIGYWENIRSRYGLFKLLNITLGKGILSPVAEDGTTVYLDDITINGELYEIEGRVEQSPENAADYLVIKGVPADGIKAARGLAKPFNPKSKAPEAILKD